MAKGRSSVSLPAANCSLALNSCGSAGATRLCRRHRQNDERPFDRPDALLRRGDRRVDHAMGVPMRPMMVMPLPAMVLSAMVLSVRVEAEPVANLRQHERPHRYLVS